MDDKDKDWYDLDPERDDYFDEFASPNYNPDADMDEERFMKLQLGDIVYYAFVILVLVVIAIKIL